ncbi:hypothetical protein [Mycobacterium riyadhense]|uniref:Lipoprotein n=1 Tax=Mycobacterium riyadhense TaxID=486698 RepID=A0A1X2CZF2_9MYCO|nr:hypothetical protein [Mycobacterium riyadhense]MCV7147765.1 hypothetical protein [Mycobacterium riyadhense]ORW81230.1 hypothetical protein AWC22_17080 [Mycobacterium riyadhense]VTP01542.1 hypothetical protein BIN_B_04072 [Mycobacterium riyadhense]
MRSTATAAIAARCATAVVILVGWVASAGVAAADPQPSPEPSPAPAPSSSPAPAPALKTTIDKDGTYAVGTDIAPGTYTSAGPVGNGTCYWKRMGNPDGALIDNAMSKKPQVVQIEPTDKAFKTNGCQPWQIAPPGDGNVPGDLPGPVAGAQLQANLGILNGLLGQVGQQVPQP